MEGRSIEGRWHPSIGEYQRTLSITLVNFVNRVINLTLRSFFRESRREAILYCRAMNKLYIVNPLYKEFYEKCKCKLRNVGLTTMGEDMRQGGRPRREAEEPDSPFGEALKEHLRRVKNFTQAELAKE